jgi:hypothetical protein
MRGGFATPIDIGPAQHRLILLHSSLRYDGANRDAVRCFTVEHFRGEKMKFLVAASALIAAWAAMTASAQAQQQNQINAASNVGQHAAAASARGSANDAQKVKANDKAYDAALKNLPDKQYDPWRGVR